MRETILVTIVLMLAVSCSDASQDRNSAGADKKGAAIGGCVIDTIVIGTGLLRAPAPRGRAARIDILSLKPAGNELFLRAAGELTALLDSAGVTVYSRSELLHVKKGACWPAYRITLLIDADPGDRGEAIRAALEGTHLADAAPAAERPEGYGLFFVTCGKGDRDWWTVWYTDRSGN
ncbi:MAG TPA: hypothetical protein VMX58_02160 [Patescibacteria group bacterium]|nr:hypothetical protein [Patescibacteria group bacterium]